MDYDEEMEEVLEELDMDAELCPDSAGKRTADTIDRFLGEGKKENAAILPPMYYGDLLAWALQNYIKSEGWKIVKVLNHSLPVPRYTNVNTDYDRHENILCDGCLLLQKQKTRVVATIKANPFRPVSLVITGSVTNKKEVRLFAEGIDKFIKENNLYKGKKIEFCGRIRFLKLSPKGWQDLALTPALKDEIIANTVSFLDRRAELARYGIPPRRGVLMIGKPGTGKTLICKILINHSPGITCIVADESGLMHSRYIYELYQLAQDLKPSMVLIEDIDLVGQDRMESHYTRGDALATLLSALDGVQECKEVVTVATANCLEILDKALRERPSRFDRIIQLLPPPLEVREELVHSICQTIPVEEDIQSYIAERTENFTPAQIQEVIYSLVIEHRHNLHCDKLGHCQFSLDEVDNALSKISRKSGHLGFIIPRGNGNSSGLKTLSPLNLNKKGEYNGNKYTPQVF